MADGIMQCLPSGGVSFGILHGVDPLWIGKWILAFCGFGLFVRGV